MSTKPQIFYDGKRIDFNKGLYKLERGRMSENNRTVMRNGKISDLNFYEKDTLSVEIRYEKADPAIIDMMEFWKHAGAGGTFGFVINPDIVFHTNFQTLESTDKRVLTFTRSNTSATFYTEQGFDSFLRATSGANKPIYDVGPFTANRQGKSIVLQNAMTNEVNDPIDLTGWTSTNATMSATTAVFDPSGSTGAYLWTCGGAPFPTGAFATCLCENGVGSSDYLFGSIWARTSHGTLRTELNILVGGNVGSSNTLLTMTPSWQQIKMQRLAGETNPSYLRLAVGPTGGGGVPDRDLYLWGPMYNRNNGDATILIRPGSVANKASEQLIIPANPTVGVNRMPESGTLLFWYNPMLTTVDHTGTMSICTIYNENNKPLGVIYKNGDHWSAVFYNTRGTSVFGAGVFPSTIEGWNLFAFGWDASTGRKILSVQNSAGFESDEDNGAAISPAYGTYSVRFGPVTQISSAKWAFKLGEVTLYSRCLPNSEIQAIYNSGYGLGVFRNRYANLKAQRAEYKPELRRGVPYYRFELDMTEAE